VPVVFIVSDEWDLRGAVRAELRESGVEALGFETVDDMAKTIARGIAPQLVLLDGALLHQELARRELANLASHLPVLIVDSRLNPAPPLANAEVIFRPVQIVEIVARVKRNLGSAGGS
jgi:DNA-binding response OmpR family regulator